MQLVGRPSCLPQKIPTKNVRFDPLRSIQQGNILRTQNITRRQGESQPSKQDLLLAEEDCPVPKEQQPMYELKSLEQMLMFNWATLPLPAFIQRLAIVYVGFFMFIGIPISAFTFDPAQEFVQFFSSASIGCLFIVTITVLRLYLGWAYVGNRLLSATVEYEESGWYDGQVWVKPPQVLMRDRLLGNYTVKPTLQRLRNTLVSLAGGLTTTVAVLLASPPASVQSMPANMLPMGYVGDSGRQVSMESYENNVRDYEGVDLSEDDDDFNAESQRQKMSNMLGRQMTVYKYDVDA